jgi:hypothetical protein
MQVSCNIFCHFFRANSAKWGLSYHAMPSSYAKGRWPYGLGAVSGQREAMANWKASPFADDLPIKIGDFP